MISVGSHAVRAPSDSAPSHHTQTHDVILDTHDPENELYDTGFMHDFNAHRLRKRLQYNDGTIGEFGLDGLALDARTNAHNGIQAKLYAKGNTITAAHLGTYQSDVRRPHPTEAQEPNERYTGTLHRDVR
ncbi:MAG: hypothetical protein SGPRY_000285 [Prymnesium sp.]